MGGRILVCIIPSQQQPCRGLLCCPRAWQPWELRPPHWDTGQKADLTETGNAGTRDDIGGRAGEGTARWCIVFKKTFFIGNKKKHVSWRCSNVHKGYSSSPPIAPPRNPGRSSSSCGLLTFLYVDNTRTLSHTVTRLQTRTHTIICSQACSLTHTVPHTHKHTVALTGTFLSRKHTLSPSVTLCNHCCLPPHTCPH